MVAPGFPTWTELGKSWTSLLEPENFLCERPQKGRQLFEERRIGGSFDDKADLLFRASALSHRHSPEIQRFEGSVPLKHKLPI